MVMNKTWCFLHNLTLLLTVLPLDEVGNTCNYSVKPNIEVHFLHKWVSFLFSCVLWVNEAHFLTPPCVYHTSISVSVFSIYIVCLMSATNQKCWWKVPIFWKCCISQNFNDIIDYVIQIILKSKNRMWELVKRVSWSI